MDAFAAWRKTNYALRHANVTFHCPYSAINSGSRAYIFLNESNFNSTEKKSNIRAHFPLHENFEIWEFNNYDYRTISKKWLDADNIKLKT